MYEKRNSRKARGQDVTPLFSTYAALSSDWDSRVCAIAGEKKSQLIHLSRVLGSPEIESSRRDAILRGGAASVEKKSRAESREGRNFVNRVGLPLEGVGASVHHIDRGGGRDTLLVYMYVRACVGA